jgi:hypothetical protein
VEEAANTLPELLVAVVAVETLTEEVVWFGMEELRVEEGHWKPWNWYYTGPLAMVLGVGLPSNCSLSCPWNCCCMAVQEVPD